MLPAMSKLGGSRTELWLIALASVVGGAGVGALMSYGLPPPPLNMPATWRWLIGLGGVCIVVGVPFSWAIWKGLHSHGDRQGWPGSAGERTGGLPIATGILERLIFATMIAMDVNGSGSAMIAWVGVKLAAGWTRGPTKNLDHPKFLLGVRARAFAGLFCSMVSIGIALVAGLICNGKLPLSR